MADVKRRKKVFFVEDQEAFTSEEAAEIAEEFYRCWRNGSQSRLHFLIMRLILVVITSHNVSQNIRSSRRWPS